MGQAGRLAFAEGAACARLIKIYGKCEGVFRNSFFKPLQRKMRKYPI
jgi:hypothetical protein